MKLAAKQIDGFLKQPAQVEGCLVYGPDRGLIRERVNQIADIILKDSDPAFNRTDLDEDALMQDPASLADGLAAMSLMGGKRLVVLRDAGDKCSSIIQEAMEGIKEAYLLVYADELGPKSSLRQLFEKQASLAALPCYKDEGYGLTQLIQQTLATHQLRAERSVVDYLSARLGGDRMMILSELEKIALYFQGETQVTLDGARMLVESDQETTLDEVTHAFALRQAKPLCEALDRLLIAGIQPIMFLRSIDRLLGRIGEIHVHRAGGKSIDAAVQALRPPVFFKQQSLYAQFARNWNEEQIRKTRHQLMRLEVITKTKNETAEIEMKQGLLHLMRAGSNAVAKAA